MTLPALSKQKIIAALLEMRKNYDHSDSLFAKQYGLSPGVFSRLKTTGITDNLISDAKLVTIGRKLNVALMDAPEWNIVKTETFEFVTEQLGICQNESDARLLVEMAGIGKTTAAKQFMLMNKNVFYVDCSQAKTKRLFIMALAKAMGVSCNNTLADITADIKFFLCGMRKPLIILDEFGDLEYNAFLEIKSFWNGTENACGWYAMGADGLKAKIERGISTKRVGFTEFFRRFGQDYMTVRPPMDPAQKRMFITAHMEMVIAANMPSMTLKELMPRSEHTGEVLSLTRVKERIIKMKRDKTYGA